MKEKTIRKIGRKIAAVIMALCMVIGSLSAAPAMKAEAGYWLSTIYADSWSDINKINSSTSNRTNITVYLDENITQTKSLNAAWHNITIDLRGHTLYLNRSVYATDHSIVIMDSTGSGTVVISQATSTGCLYARSGGTIEIHSGVTVRKNYGTSSTVCALGASSGSTLNVNSGAVISGFEYGAYLGSGSTMNLNGTVQSCTVDGVRGYGTLNMNSGAVIKGCKGDGVDLSGGTLNMTGGSITGGTLYNRYGVRISSGTKANFSGTATVTGNKGGNVYVPNGYGKNVTISGNVNLGFTSNTTLTEGNKIQLANGKATNITSDNSRYIIYTDGTDTYLLAPASSCTISVISGDAGMGTVTMNGLEKSSATVKYNSEITLAATVTDSVQYEFVRWINSAGNTVSTDPKYTFKAVTNDRYTAVFDKRTYTITVQLANSSMSSMGEAYASKTSAKYGEKVTLTAIAYTNGEKKYEFKQWNDGDTNASREITVTGNMIYNAAFAVEPPSADAIGTIYSNINKMPTTNNIGTPEGYALIPQGSGSSLPTDSGVAIAGLPTGSAICKENTGSENPNALCATLEGLEGEVKYSKGDPQIKVKVIQAASGFDNCKYGGMAYFSNLKVNNESKEGWLYWCYGSAATGSVLFDVYAYGATTAFKAGDIKITRDTKEYSVANDGGTDTITASDIIPKVQVGNTTYTLTSYNFEDNSINYETGDKTVSLNLGGVLCTYDFPEAVVNGVEYKTLAEAIAKADKDHPVEVVTPYVSAITQDVTLVGGTKIIQYNGNEIVAAQNSQIQADADGTVELSSGALDVTPTNKKEETVKVDGGSVTAASKIRVSKNNGEDGVITNQNQDAQITISPDGDPTHTVTFNGCDINKTYGINQSSFTSEDYIEVSPGTDYTITTTITDGDSNTPVTVKTDVNNTGSTVYTKDGENLKIENSGNGDMLTIRTGETEGEKADPFTTQSDKTTLTVGPDTSTEEDSTDTQISLKEGGVTVPVGDSVVLPGGEKITSTGTPQTGGGSGSEGEGGGESGSEGEGGEGSGSEGEGGSSGQPQGDPITVIIPKDPQGNNQDPQIYIPDGSGADIDGQQVFVPSGDDGVNDDAKITLKHDEQGEKTGLDIEVGPGSSVGIGDDTFTAGDYGSNLDVDQDGDTTLRDGDVVLGPGSSITDGNGVTYKYDGEGQSVITANDGDNTNVALEPNDTITYQPAGGEPETYTNPGASDADFELDPDKGMSAASELQLGTGSELNLSPDGNSIKIKVPDNNTNGVLVDGSANTITVKEPGDQIRIGDTAYTATDENTTLEVGAEHNTLLSGGVELPKGADVLFNNTQITAVDPGVKVTAQKDGEGTPTGKGTVTVPAGKQFALGEDGQQVIFTNPKSTEATYNIDEAGDLHVPYGEQISFKTGKDNTIVSTASGGTPEGSEGAKINSEDGKVTVTTEGENDTITVNGHTYKSLGITMSEDEQSGTTTTDYTMELTVTQSKDVVLTRGQAQVDAGETLGVYDNDGILVKIVNKAADPSQNPVNVTASGDVTVPNTGTELSIAGMNYTTTENDTILAATTQGGQLMQGGVEFTKGNAVVANGTVIKNLGSGSMSVTINQDETADEETGYRPMTLGVPGGGSFSLTGLDNPEESYSFTNPSDSESGMSEYTVDKEGNLLLPAGGALSSKINGTDFAFSSEEDTVKLLPTSEGITATVGAGKSLTINGVTYKSTDSTTPLTIVVDKNGNVILKSGTVTMPAGASINIKKEDGSLLKLENTSSSEEGSESAGQDVTVSPEGDVKIPAGSSLKAGDTTFTATDTDTNTGVEIALGLDGSDNELVSGSDLDVTNGNIDLGEGKPTISTTGDQPVHISSPSSGQPSVEVEPGGNASFTKDAGEGETPKTVEVSVPDTNEGNQSFDFNGTDGTISTQVDEGESVVMGGVTYTSNGDQTTIAVDNEDGSFDSDKSSITEEGIEIAIDSKDFDKDNYEMQVPQGTSVTVDGVEYKSEDSDLVLHGNPDGKPIVELPNAGSTVTVGDKTYTAANDNTKLAVSGTNSVTLFDNGSTQNPSAVAITGNTAITVDGVRYAGNQEESAYTVAYGANGDVLTVPEGSKVSVNLMTTGKNVRVAGESKVGSKDADTVTDILITAKNTGAAFVIDHTTQNEDETYATALISASGRTVLEAVKASDGSIIGYTATVQSSYTSSEEKNDNQAGETVTIPVEEGSSVEISAVVTEDTVVVETLEKETLEQIVQEQLDKTTSDTETVKISLDLSSTESNSVTITVPTLENVIDTIKTNDQVEDAFSITVSGGEITLDTVAMEAIIEQATDGQIEIKVDAVTEGTLNSSQEESLQDYEVVKIIETTVTSNGVTIHNFNSGTVQVAIDFEIPAGTEKYYYHVYYVDTNGEMTRYETKYSDGKLYYTTTHFSEYAIVYDKKMRNATEEDEITKTLMYFRETKATRNSLTLKWSQVKDADGYRIWIKECGTGKSAKLLKDIGSGTTTSFTALKLKSGKNYRFTIYAYKMVDGKRVVIGQHRASVHAVTLGGKYTNPTGIKVNTGSVTLSVGKTKTIKTTVSKLGMKKFTGCTAKVRYLSTDSSVAKVNSNGKITAVSKGTCSVYAITANGRARKITVTVK